ncbi:hypothetical protein K435DRAFT_860897 [Dendrothele bispora CBS 962.96]|uniref:Uncharacterized protein n=1 Tax=Dendrothele bispora (strain CBS 962.96) TaxID=1314807 RepID=A0A4V4HF96_DENBC|nr:hypothetical protein K435DRAFT_860897 [Dendrothele bispora CBS 962.96]
MKPWFAAKWMKVFCDRVLDLERRWFEEIKKGKWTREVKGDWGRFRTPEVNGFYTVLACMRWWLVLEQKKDLDSDRASWNWKTVLSDIVWVIKTLAGKEPSEEPVSKKSLRFLRSVTQGIEVQIPRYRDRIT